MSQYPPPQGGDRWDGITLPATYAGPYVQPELIDEPQPRRSYDVPLLLFLLTCGTTFQAYYSASAHDVRASLMYAGGVMLILTTHELGHYFQAVRYGVPASLPYFIPMPFGPIGTMGAVIGMRGTMGDRRSLFDIGITGPLAGLVPTLALSALGLYWSHPEAPQPQAGGMELGTPLLFKLLLGWFFGPLPAGWHIAPHPLAFAGWVGIFITALNLVPISQLDGGHIIYALLRRKAQIVMTWLLWAAIVAVVLTKNWGWVPMLALLVFVGPNHPPTSNDNVPLGRGRTILGWATLMFVFLGFIPQPFREVPRQRPPHRPAARPWEVRAEPRPATRVSADLAGGALRHGSSSVVGRGFTLDDLERLEHLGRNPPQRSGRNVNKRPLRAGRSQELPVAGAYDLVDAQRREVLEVTYPSADHQPVSLEGRHEVFDLMRAHDPRGTQRQVAVGRPAALA